jgi:hypothetical protein
MYVSSSSSVTRNTQYVHGCEFSASGLAAADVFAASATRIVASGKTLRQVQFAAWLTPEQTGGRSAV